ncbi:MAG: phosphotransacetylase [Acidobacteria bacterium]|nr:phosphotransacetylase [Acidobacteriota bacterium]
MQIPESAQEYFALQTARLRKQLKKKRIAFPEGEDPRVIEAASRLCREELVIPILMGRPKGDVASCVVVEQPENNPKLKEYAQVLRDRRRARGMTETEAQRMALDPLVFAGLMVTSGDADGFVGGAATTTADTFRAAHMTIGMRPDIKTASGMMVVCTHARHCGADGVLAMADPALMIEPTASQLADIAIATAETTKSVIGVEPVVAMLSFSTKGSAKHPLASKVIEARRIVEARRPDIHVDGELQADAALIDSIGRSKAPGSTVAGRANTLIFPDVGAANIGVKLVERLGGAVCTGPLFQGFNKPANDLSRGCTGEDIYRLAILTALQAGA